MPWDNERQRMVDTAGELEGLRTMPRKIENCGRCSGTHGSMGPCPGPKLPDDSAARKNAPMARGLLDYFPDALFAVAELSQIANEKHNPGEPLHWSKEKSNDHADCIVRHLVDRGKWDTTGAKPVRHSTEVAWRALALLQTEIEAEKDSA